MNARSLFHLALILALLGLPAALPSQEKAKGKTSPPEAERLVIAKGLKASPGAIETIIAAADARERSLGEDDDNAASFTDGNTRYVVLNLEFKDAPSCLEFGLPGTKVITRHDRFAQIFAKSHKPLIDDIEKYAGLVWLDYDRTNLLPPPSRPVPKKETARAPAEKIVRGGVGGITGKGVIIAVIDSGVDFRHPDFIS